MKHLDLEILRTFVAVVERGSFACAAQVVLRSHSAVTQQMQRLEALVNRSLFTRVGKGKQLTEDGQKVLAYAHRMLALNDEALFSLSGFTATGEIRLGAPHDVTDTVLPNLLAYFARRYPDLRISIHVGRSPFLIADLKRGDLDMTIAALDAPDLRYLPLRTSPIVWMAASTYRHDTDQPVPLIVADELSYFRRVAIDHLNQAAIPWRISYTSPTLVGVRAAVKAGLGVTARSIEMLGPDLRVIGANENMPRLPDVCFKLFLGSVKSNPLARQLFDALENSNI